jgi:hypothetical protein
MLDVRSLASDVQEKQMTDDRPGGTCYRALNSGSTPMGSIVLLLMIAIDL